MRNCWCGEELDEYGLCPVAPPPPKPKRIVLHTEVVVPGFGIPPEAWPRVPGPTRVEATERLIEFVHNHGPDARYRYCEKCRTRQRVEDDRTETEEPRSLREWRVIDLDCGHRIETLIPAEETLRRIR